MLRLPHLPAFAAAQILRCGMRASAFPPSPATVGAGASDETGPSAPERAALWMERKYVEVTGDDPWSQAGDDPS